MNSSVGTGFTFCPFSRSEIASHVASNSTCLSGSRCDLTADGSVNVLDIQLLINTILGIPGSIGSADINDDGSTNVLDLQLLINVILGLRGCPG